MRPVHLHARGKRTDMPAEIISVGTELLLGQITDTNATYICQRLAEVGVDVFWRTTVGDNQARIVQAIRQAAQRADIIVVSGGLGPTTDDLTREAIAEVMGVPLCRDVTEEAAIVERFRRMGRPMVPSNLKQADVPLGARLIPNPCGTAPGVLAEYGGATIYAVPGVPREMRAMVADAVIPDLKARGMAGGHVLRSRVLRLVGVGESTAAKAVEDLLTSQLNPTIAPLAGHGEVLLRISAKSVTWDEAGRQIEALERVVRDRLGQWVYGADDESLEHVVVRILVERGLSLATAESCTGGLISSRLTDVPGSSRCFAGGIVCYSNEAKTGLLGVNEEVLRQHGAVSAEVAELIARGARERLGTDIGISATGIAGPTGATEGKPVGLTFVGIVHGGGAEVEKHLFAGDRYDNRFRTSQAALDLIRRHLLGSQIEPRC